MINFSFFKGLADPPLLKRQHTMKLHTISLVRHAVLAVLTLVGASSNAQTPAEVVKHHAQLVHASYEDTLQSALSLQTAVNAFNAKPSDESLAAAKKTWLAARELYGQTEAFRFYGGPIDNDKGPEGRMNAWPMDESYIDYVKGKPKTGLINNPRVKISKTQLAAMNERGGEENIATGWHAIEFMLWGQDLSDTSAGNRPVADFIDGQSPNADRRREYLKVVTELLIDDLGSLVKAWAPGAKNYRARFEAGGNESLRKMLVGIGSLSRGELAGERLEVALASQDQEDEHSCFADNTHRDVVNNAQGIQNVWTGRYKRLDGSELSGPGIKALVELKDKALAEKTDAQIANSVKTAQAIPAPFDQAIKGAKDAPGRKLIQDTIASLTEQSKLIVSSAGSVGITKLNLTLPK
jgi:putative iron-regulated protein